MENKYLIVTFTIVNGLECTYYDDYPGDVISELNRIDILDNMQNSYNGIAAWVLYHYDGSFYSLYDSDGINPNMQRIIDFYVDAELNKLFDR